VTRTRAYAVVATAALLPRVVVLAVERGDILTRFAEKSDDFAKTFVSSGTYGFVPGEPSAYTQPLYGFFLVPLYWIFGRHWPVVGIAQALVSAATALLVYEIGRRIAGPRLGLVGAVVATLNPYLVWHDVHVNREVVDQLVAAALVLCVLVAAERRSVAWSAAAGLVAGVGILGNTRLVLVPLVLALYLLWCHVPWQGALALVLVAAVAVMPWVVRNRVAVGCFALTTDTRALWKANNPQTYGVLTHGGWIDDVKSPPGHSFTPEFARDLYRETGRIRHVDECGDMRYFDRRVWTFWRRHPGEKAKLMQLAVRMEWDPRPTRTTTTEGAAFVRSWVQPVYESLLYALALVGLALVPRRFAVLVIALLAYQTLAAIVFVGATRYRVPWDFLLALLAAASLARLGSLVREGRASAPDPWHRRLGASPADAPAGAGSAGSGAGARRARRSRG
jgi:4-amino-4-deoxy-L-arabinose transferase-like glycosyltransferase